MMLRTLIPAFLIVGGLTACFNDPSLRRSEFVYNDGSPTLQRITLPVPKGYVEDRTLLDTNGGKEQYYYYPSGAVFYFANKVTWNTENDSLIRAQPGARSQPQRTSYTYKGVDANGLHWKEIRIHDFRYGYSYVPKELVGAFNDALNSMRIR